MKQNGQIIQNCCVEIDFVQVNSPIPPTGCDLSITIKENGPYISNVNNDLFEFYTCELNYNNINNNNNIGCNDGYEICSTIPNNCNIMLNNEKRDINLKNKGFIANDSNICGVQNQINGILCCLKSINSVLASKKLINKPLINIIKYNKKKYLII